MAQDGRVVGGRVVGGAYGLRTRLKVLRQEGRRDRGLRRWYPWWQLVDDHAFLDLTSPWEQAWMRREIRRRRPAADAVVELGTWLGATTRAITGGGHPAPHVYDTFTFVDVEPRVAGTPLEGRHHEGEDFVDLFQRRAGGAPVVHRGDVLVAGWDGPPIEVLFVDLAKTWEIWRHVRTTFVRPVEVGGLVVQQDWAHANTPWLHLWHHRWRDHFEPLGPIAHSSAVPFRLRRPLPEAAFDHDELADHAPDEIDAAFTWAAGLVDPELRPNLAAAKVVLHVLHGRVDDAVATLLAEADRVPVVGELADTAIPLVARRVAEEVERPAR